MIDISIIVPFYNPPFESFKKCLEHLRYLHVKEVILVDDCSTDKKVVDLAKQSNFNYECTPYQSGHDGLPFNLGVQKASSTYVCKVDADDFLLDLPSSMTHDFHLARMNRSADPIGINIEKLILAPRSIFNGAVIPKDLMLKMPYDESGNYFGDVLAVLRLLYRKHTFSIHPKINYLYNRTSNSIQTKFPEHYHRYRNLQTVARFAQLENMSVHQTEYYMKLALLNLRYGAKSLQFLKAK